MNNKLISNKYFFLWLFIPMAVYFYFGLQHLTKFETADEHYWMYSNYNNNDYWKNNDGRIHQYWEALLKGDWKKTRINDKPGITLAYVSGIGSWLKTNLEKETLSGAVAPMSKMEKAEKINFYFRFPLLLFSGFFSLIFFYLVRKLAQNDWIALLSATFILLSPILLGISQIVNPDSLLWVFSFTAILTYLIHLRENSRAYALWTALFLGLSLLTKYSSVILFFFFFAVMLAYFIENLLSWDKKIATQKIRRYAFTYFFIIAGALLIYAVLLPDNLVELRHFMKGSLGFKGMQYLFWMLFGSNLLILLDAYFFQSKIAYWIVKRAIVLEKYLKMAVFGILSAIFIIIICNTLFGKDWLNLFVTPFDASINAIFRLPSDKVIFKQFLALIFSLSPVAIFFLLYAWIKSLLKPDKFQWIIFIFSSFILMLVVASIQQQILLTIRYSIMLYPLIFTITAIGVYQFFALDKKSDFFKAVIFVGIIFAGIISLWQTKPFYFNYTNFLLPQKYLVTDAWGYGGYEAAQQLNQLPNANQMRVWSDYNGSCLFFNGNCVANYLTMKNIRRDSKQDLPKFDYFVSNRRGKILSNKVWRTLPDEYQSEQIWELIINNRPENFVKIYKNKIYEK